MTFKRRRSLRNKLQGDFPHVRVVSVKLSTGRWYRVQVGEFHTKSRARAAAKKLQAHWGVTPMVLEP